jgi:hypothetical protein
MCPTCSSLASTAAADCAVRVWPKLMSSIDCAMSSAMPRADSALRCARLRTSCATTANPWPASPASAASTEALSARMLVRKAMPSIRSMISPMRRLLCCNVSMRSRNLCIWLRLRAACRRNACTAAIASSTRRPLVSRLNTCAPRPSS